ncbi:MAG: hypothetical protein V4447_13630 [Pseudomonadota bacterium]
MPIIKIEVEKIVAQRDTLHLCLHRLRDGHEISFIDILRRFLDCHLHRQHRRSHAGAGRRGSFPPWIFTRTPGGLDLRHDHLHPDGTPEEVTMYGGMANDAGSALSQSFLADAHTFKVFPGSETNVWTTSFSADGAVLTYHLDRHAKPRIEFVFKRVAR